MEINVKSNLFQEVPMSDIERICREKLNMNEIISAELISGGMFNTTYKVTSETDTVILRFAPVNLHLLMGFESRLMDAENYVYELCKKHQIPCPAVLICDTTKQLLDRDYMIMEFIPGIVMPDAGLTEDGKSILFQKIGAYASKLHKIRGSQFGFVSQLLSGKGNSSWSECLLMEAEDILFCLKQMDGVTSEEFDLIRNVFIDNESLLDEITTPCLLHTDLWEGNVIVSKTGENTDINGVIDGDRAMFGDEDFEWAAPWMNIPDIYLGAGINMEEFNSPSRKKRRQIYQIIYYLIESYVGLGEYNNPLQYQNGKKELLKLAEMLSENMGDG